MRKILTVLLLITCPATGFSPETPKSNQPDLSGTWVLDMDRSNFGGPKSDLIYDSLTLVIEHREPEIKIRRILVKKRKETTHTLTYYTDHRGEVNKSPSQSQTKSKARWEDNKLIITEATSMAVPGNAIYIDSIDTWELTDSGRILVQTTTSRMDGGVGRTIILDRDKNTTTQKIYRKVN